ncbi:hypothetical protein SAMN05660226_02302 [Parapedobacter luteus]|uniref:FUSC family protein n=1 Tax=Parapedobacter luteus TaxID=623280 RepID=A0A1T5CSG3_9SPHI|nr:hypothetical protein [Parapedobacter luteus]SKB62438.1 hypothetical protein SAMN05660226_02302 [Parapedobacter luteus]
MKPEGLSEYTNEELQQKFKEIKTGKITNAFIFGATFGIFFYSAINNGFGLATFFPLAIAYPIIKNSKNDKIIEKEVQKKTNIKKPKIGMEGSGNLHLP